ncbi:MAG: hypothetical protein IPK88_18365 [Saprospiraceae bacterium]|nr:hypothetical protein [Candidatus Defluviibacterium haderslevense]
MKIDKYICALLIISAVLFPSCNPNPISQEISIVLDLTSEHFSHISLNDFKKKSIISKNVNNSEAVRIQGITEFGFNEVKSFMLDSVSSALLSNDYERKHVIKKYYSNIDSTLLELNNNKKERVGSVIFKIISEELNILSKSKYDKKILIINTDLMDKSFIDFYDQEIFNELVNQPTHIQNLLIEKYPLNKLSGIEIYILYKPIDKMDSERFEIVSDFYKLFLESNGAHVSIGSNL